MRVKGGQGKWVRRGEALEEQARVRVERLKSPISDGERHCCVKMSELCDGGADGRTDTEVVYQGPGGEWRG